MLATTVKLASRGGGQAGSCRTQEAGRGSHAGDRGHRANASSYESTTSPFSDMGTPQDVVIVEAFASIGWNEGTGGGVGVGKMGPIIAHGGESGVTKNV